MKDDKLSAEGTMKVAEMSGDPAKVKNSEAVVKGCQSVGGGDRYVFDSSIHGVIKLILYSQLDVTMS